MKKIFLGLGIFLLVLVAAICALPFLIPASTYNRVAENQLEKALGRDVTLGADTRVMIFPNLGAKISSVEIANADGYPDPHFLKADELSVAVKWMPLLSQTVEIAALKFDGAEVYLHQKSATENNWTFNPGTPAEEAPDTEDQGQAQTFNAVIPKAELLRSKIIFRDDIAGTEYRVDPINMTARMNGSDSPIELAGDITLNDEKFDLELITGSLNSLTTQETLPVDLNVKSDPADFGFVGEITLADAVSINGTMEAALRDAPKLLAMLDMELDQDLTVLGTVEAKGTISGEVSQLKLENLQVSQNGKSVKSTYTGDVLLAETPVLNGAATFETGQLGDLMSALEIPTEQDLNALGDIRGAAKLSGSPDNLRASDVNVSVSGPNLTSSFAGELSLTKAGPGLSGNLKAESNTVRKLLSDLGVDYKPPTNDALKSFRADIVLTQAPNRTNAKINSMMLDNLAVDGSIGLSLAGDTPYLDLDLALPKADLSPYLSDTKKPPSQSDPSAGWSPEPIDFSALKSVNADADIYVGELTDGRATVRDIRLLGSLLNGKFDGKLTSLQPDGGRQGDPVGIDPLFNGSITVASEISVRPDGSARLALQSDGSGITTAALIRFFTGMDVLEGVASLKSDINTEGVSIADFVKNVNGSYQAQVADGAIFGVNLPQLLRSAQNALLSGKLPSALSPGEKTDFSSLQLNGNIEQGIANIELFQLNAPFVRATATGKIDLFNRTLDIRFMPKAVNSAQGQDSDLGINGFGIPLKIYGDWTSIKGSLDTDFLVNLAKQEATNRLADEVTSRLGDDVGSVLDSALGIKRTPKAEDTSTEDAATQTNEGDTPAETEAEPAPQEQSVEDAAKSLLRDVLTGKKKND